MDPRDIIRKLDDAGRLKPRPHIAARTNIELIRTHLSLISEFMHEPPRSPESMRGAIEGMLDHALQLAQRLYPDTPAPERPAVAAEPAPSEVAANPPETAVPTFPTADGWSPADHEPPEGTPRRRRRRGGLEVGE